MKRRILHLIAWALFLASGLSMAQTRLEGDDKVREAQLTYVIEHKDGAKERVLVTYEAMLYYRTWQTGSAARCNGFHCKEDDRQCHYTADARVYRRAYVLTRSGVPAAVEPYQAVYQASQSVSRGGTNFLQRLGGYHVTCGDVNLFRDRVQGGKAALIAQFDELVAKDDDKARARLKSMLLGDKIKRVNAR